MPTAARHHRDTERVPTTEAGGQSCRVPRGYAKHGSGRLDIVDVPEPEAGPGQQLYDVSTAGLNFADTHHSLS